MRGRLVGAGLVLILCGCGGVGGGPGATATTSPSPHATPEPQVQTVYEVPSSIASAAHPVFWYRSAPSSPTLVAYDWDGRRAGELRIDTTGPVGVIPSPSGTRLLVYGATRVLGARVMGRFSSQPVWAHDDDHLCEFRSTDGRSRGDVDMMSLPVDTALWLDDASGGGRRLLDYGSFGAHGGPLTLACSVPDDRALLGESFTGSSANLRMVRLSDGGAVRFPLQLESTAGKVASADARYIGVGDTVNTFGRQPPGFEVRDTATGAMLARVSSGGIDSFSDDDSRALTTAFPAQSTETVVYALVDWRSGRVLTSRTMGPATVLARPHSGDFLVGEGHRDLPPGARTAVFTEDVWIVRSDGTWVHVASGLAALW